MVTVPVKRKVLVPLGSAVIGHLKKGQKTRIEKSHIRIKTRIRTETKRKQGIRIRVAIRIKRIVKRKKRKKIRKNGNERGKEREKRNQKVQRVKTIRPLTKRLVILIITTEFHLNSLLI